MNVEVVDGEIIESSEDFLREDLCREGIELREVVFWMCSIVRL